MSPDILRGYQFSRTASRYRDTSTGRFVSQARITNLLEQQVNHAETRLGNIVQGVFTKEIAPGVAQTLMRDELRRLNLQERALGKGGFDRLSFRDFGAVGNQLRDSYARMTNLVQGIENGTVTLPQALNRIQGYVLEARQQFFKAERDALRESGRRFEEHRRLHASESCEDCIGYARMGWQPLGVLPLPGERSVCNKRCRCTIERREVAEEVREERVMA